MPSIADMDGDGHPEVVVEGGILNGQTGALLHALEVVGPIVLGDIYGDGKLDVVTASQAFVVDGSLTPTAAGRFCVNETVIARRLAD